VAGRWQVVFGGLMLVWLINGIINLSLQGLVN